MDTTSSFEEAVLRAVNLGDDADSVGAVAGQLAGARYGMGAIPAGWRKELVGAKNIEKVGRALFAAGHG